MPMLKVFMPVNENTLWATSSSFGMSTRWPFTATMNSGRNCRLRCEIFTGVSGGLPSSVLSSQMTADSFSPDVELELVPALGPRRTRPETVPALAAVPENRPAAKAAIKSFFKASSKNSSMLDSLAGAESDALHCRDIASTGSQWSENTFASNYSATYQGNKFSIGAILFRFRKIGRRKIGQLIQHRIFEFCDNYYLFQKNGALNSAPLIQIYRLTSSSAGTLP